MWHALVDKTLSDVVLGLVVGVRQIYLDVIYELNKEQKE